MHGSETLSFGRGGRELPHSMPLSCRRLSTDEMGRTLPTILGRPKLVVWRVRPKGPARHGKRCIIENMIALTCTYRGTIVLALGAAVAASACSRGSGAAKDTGAVEEWSVQDLPSRRPLRAIHGAGADLYVAGESGTILRSADGARTWTDVSVAPASVGATSESVFHFRSIGASADNDVWVIATSPMSGPLMHTTDRGQSWQQVDAGTLGYLGGVWPIDGNRAFLTTEGQILATTDGGTRWTVVFSGSGIVLNGIWGSASNDLYVVGGVVSTADDGDAGTNTHEGGTTPDAGTDATTAYLGLVLHSSDGGMSWQRIEDATTACELWHVSGSPDGATVFAAGTCGSVAHTTDYGASWSTSGAASAGHDYDITDVWVSPIGTSYLLAQGRGYANLAGRGNQMVCRDIKVEDDRNLSIQTAGCESLPPSGGLSASPMGVWGTSDNNVWIVSAGSILWHRD